MVIYDQIFSNKINCVCPPLRARRAPGVSCSGARRIQGRPSRMAGAKMPLLLERILISTAGVPQFTLSLSKGGNDGEDGAGPGCGIDDRLRGLVESPGP